MKERARTAGRPGACLDGLPTRTCRGFLCVAAGWAIPPMRWSKQMRSGPKEPQVCVTVRSASQIITSSGRSSPEPTAGQLRDQQAFRFPRNESGRDTPDPTARPAGAYRSQLTATVTATAATGGNQRRSATAHNARTICQLGICPAISRRSRISAVRLRLLPILLPRRRTTPARDGQSWNIGPAHRT